MNVMDYVRSALRHWLIILLAGVLAAAAGLLFGKSQPAQFQTHARFVISPSPEITDDNNIAQTLDALANKRAIVSTFAQVVLSQRSFDEASRGARATPQEAEQVKISTVVSPEANVVEVFVIGPRPRLIEQMLELLGTESTRAFEALYTIYAVEALDVAGPKTEQVAPKPVRSALIGGVLGGALAFLIGLVDDATKVARAGTGQPKSDDDGSRSGTRVFGDDGDWLRELDDLDREVRRWTDGVSSQEVEEAQRRWRSELDDLSGMLRAWAEGRQEGAGGDGRPDAPSVR